MAYAINRQIYREPGTDWYYADGDAETFSRIIKAATGMPVSEYAQEKLFGPIGMQVANWLTDNAGQEMTYCCIISTARDFARFGYLYLRNGKWGDTAGGAGGLGEARRRSRRRSRTRTTATSGGCSTCRTCRRTCSRRWASRRSGST